jgi:hypothetical protein
MYLAVLLFCLFILLCLAAALQRRKPTATPNAPRPVLLKRSPFLEDERLTVVLFPHCGREAFALVLVEELSQYLAQFQKPFLILGVQQLDTPDALRRYCKGLSWNVALHWLQSQGAGPDLALTLQDVDAIPRHNVSYECPPLGKAEVWWQTTGGIKVRFGDVLKVNGYPISAKGWGREDQDFWLRLRRAGVKLEEWPDSLTEDHPAVVLNLEWMTESEEPFLRDYYWGRWAERVHTVSQQNKRWGLKTPVTIPVKTWFSPETFGRNRRLSDIINKLGDESYWDHVGQDGLKGLQFLSEPRLNNFFGRIPMPSGILALNLTFELKNVAVNDGLHRRENLLWYSNEPQSCASDKDCPASLTCEDSQCLWPFSD